MKGKSLLAACLIVPLAVLTLFVFFYGDYKKLDVDRYGFFRPHDDNLVVQFGQQLVWLGQSGREERSQDLSALGIHAEGDYDFFSMGELLVYNRATDPGLLYNLERFFRLQKRDAAPSPGADGLYRCDLQAYHCERFAPQLPVFDSSFRLIIDRETDTVYLADTPGFKLYKLSDSGETLATSDDSSFRFPNQLVLRNNDLWLADTNNHRLVSIDTDTDGFAEIQEAITVDLGGAYRWPHQFASSGEGWWVNIGDNNMSNGRIVHLTRSGERDNSLDRSDIADPLAIAYWQDTLWVVDFAEPILQRYDAEGAVPGRVESPTLDTLAAQSRADYDYYQLLSYLGLGGFVLVLIGGFGAAWVLEKQQTIEQFKTLTSGGLDELVARPAKETSGSQIHWLTNTMQQKRRVWTIALVAIPVVLLLSLSLVFGGGEELSSELLRLVLAALIFIVVIVATLYWLLQRACQQKLGVIGNSIVLQQSEIRRTIARAEEVSYANTHLMADDVIVTLGNPHHRFFDRKELEDYLFPRLKGAQKFSQFALIKHLWRAREPQVIGPLIIVLMSLMLYMWIQV